MKYAIRLGLTEKDAGPYLADPMLCESRFIDDQRRAWKWSELQDHAARQVRTVVMRCGYGCRLVRIVKKKKSVPA